VTTHPYPRRQHLDIQQGATWERELYVLDASGTAVSLTTDTLECQIRSSPGGGIYATPTVTKSLVTSGLITLSLTAAQTEALLAGTYVYDVERTTSGGATYRTHEGEVRVHGEVTA
jgi:hypothetical protein